MELVVVAATAEADAEQAVAAGARVVVWGPDATVVGPLVTRLNQRGPGRAAGFVGSDVEAARAMGEEVFARDISIG